MRFNDASIFGAGGIGAFERIDHAIGGARAQSLVDVGRQLRKALFVIGLAAESGDGHDVRGCERRE